MTVRHTRVSRNTVGLISYLILLYYELRCIFVNLLSTLLICSSLDVIAASATPTGSNAPIVDTYR